MSKFDKLIKEILSLSKDLRFSELKKVLENYGYTMESPEAGAVILLFAKGVQPDHDSQTRADKADICAESKRDSGG